MKLYSFPGSCALASNIALEWSGKPYELELVKKDDLASGAFHKVNPMGKVPALDVDGWELTENAAILNYIADIAPEAHLAGDGTARGRAEVNRWIGFVNSEVHPAYKPLFGTTAYLEDEAVIAKTQDNARKRLRQLFERVDAHLAHQDWLAGDRRSVADPYLFITLVWSHIVKVDTTGLTHLADFEKRMRADTGVKAALKAQGLDQAH